MRLIYSILKRFSNRDLLDIRKIITDILSIKLPHRERSKLFWENGNYMKNLYISQASPSKDDLNIYKTYLTDNKQDNKKVLLLGSTPLLRNLLKELGFRNYVIADFSFIIIENSLQTLNKLKIDLNTEKMVTSETFENTAEQRFALLYRLRNGLRNKKTQTTSPQKIVDEILRYRYENETELEFLKSVLKMISKRAEIRLPFITQTKDELENVISKEFSLETIVTASDYASEYFPIYVLKKT